MSGAGKIAEARGLIAPLTGHTPGPWVADLGETYTVRDRDNARLAGCSHLTNFGRRPNDEVAATCRTMAASPALRETVAALADHAEALEAENAKMREALAPCVKLLLGLVAESGRSVGWGEEDSFRMGEWFEAEDLAAIKAARAALNASEANA